MANARCDRDGEHQRCDQEIVMLHLSLGSDSENADARDRPQTGGAAGDRLPMHDDQPDDLAKADGGHRQIIGAQAHGRQTEHEARGDHDDGRQKGCRDPWQAGLGCDRRGIGAEPIECGLPEVDLAGPTRHKIQSEHDNRIENGDIEQLDDVAVPGDEREPPKRPRCLPREETRLSSQTFSLLFSPNRPRGQAMRTVIMTMKA